MEINKVDMFKLSDFAEDERVFISIVNDGEKILVEPLSSNTNPDVLEDDILSDLKVGNMIRSFNEEEGLPESFGVVVRIR